MEKKACKNCWDFWKCRSEVMKKCPAYTTKSGNECWMVMNGCLDNCCEESKKFKTCIECRWFKKHNPIN